MDADDDRKPMKYLFLTFFPVFSRFSQQRNFQLTFILQISRMFFSNRQHRRFREFARSCSHFSRSFECRRSGFCCSKWNEEILLCSILTRSSANTDRYELDVADWLDCSTAGWRYFRWFSNCDADKKLVWGKFNPNHCRSERERSRVEIAQTQMASTECCLWSCVDDPLFDDGCRFVSSQSRWWGIIQDNGTDLLHHATDSELGLVTDVLRPSPNWSRKSVDPDVDTDWTETNLFVGDLHHSCFIRQYLHLHIAILADQYLRGDADGSLSLLGWLRYIDTFSCFFDLCSRLSSFGVEYFHLATEFSVCSATTSTTATHARSQLALTRCFRHTHLLAHFFFTLLNTFMCFHRQTSILAFRSKHFDELLESSCWPDPSSPSR